MVLILCRGRQHEALAFKYHIEERLRGIHRRLIFSRFTDQALVVSESYVGRRDAIALIIGNNLDAPILVDAHARVCCAQVDADYRPDSQISPRVTLTKQKYHRASQDGIEFAQKCKI